MKKVLYYVLIKQNGEIGRLAKFVDNIPYGYDPTKKEWVYMPALVKIQNDVTTDYQEISEAEAEKIIGNL